MKEGAHIRLKGMICWARHNGKWSEIADARIMLCLKSLWVNFSLRRCRELNWVYVDPLAYLYYTERIPFER